MCVSIKINMSNVHWTFLLFRRLSHQLQSEICEKFKVQHDFRADVLKVLVAKARESKRWNILSTFPKNLNRIFRSDLGAMISVQEYYTPPYLASLTPALTLASFEDQVSMYAFLFLLFALGRSHK